MKPYGPYETLGFVDELSDKEVREVLGLVLEHLQLKIRVYESPDFKGFELEPNGD